MPRALLVFILLCSTAFAQVPSGATPASGPVPPANRFGPMKEVLFVIVASVVFFAVLVLWARFTMRRGQPRNEITVDGGADD